MSKASKASKGSKASKASKGSKASKASKGSKASKAGPLWSGVSDAVREQRTEYHGAAAGELKAKTYTVAGVKITAIASVIEHGGADQPRAVRGTILVGATECSKSQLLRWFGYTGWGYTAIGAFFGKIGIPVPPRNSLYSQTYDGTRIRAGKAPIRASGKENLLPAFSKQERKALETASVALLPKKA